jgi:hypothetical protein
MDMEKMKRVAGIIEESYDDSADVYVITEGEKIAAIFPAGYVTTAKAFLQKMKSKGKTGKIETHKFTK